MENMNLANVIKSFFLGIGIGIALLMYNHEAVPSDVRLISVLASGSIGFLIGFMTEWLTAMLPISLAKARTYFFINNLIAVIVAAFFMALLMIFPISSGGDKVELMPILGIVLGVICAANLFDYLMYRRTQRKLQSYKSQMQDN